MDQEVKIIKLLGIKVYGFIFYLLGSWLGLGDYYCYEGQVKIVIEKICDKYDIIIVQEKFDGFCCVVVKVVDKIIVLGCVGYFVESFEYLVYYVFVKYVKENEKWFRFLLEEGE